MSAIYNVLYTPLLYTRGHLYVIITRIIMDVHDDSPPNKKIKLSQEKGEDSSSLEKFLWTEKDVGITEYVNKVHPKLFGILKQR